MRSIRTAAERSALARMLVLLCSVLVVGLLALDRAEGGGDDTSRGGGGPTTGAGSAGKVTRP